MVLGLGGCSPRINIKMSDGTLSFILTALVGIALIPIIFIGGIFLIELWWRRNDE